MGEEAKFLAMLIVQDGIRDKEVGKRYLIQVDTEHPGERFFIDITGVVLRVLDGSMPKSGEYWVGGDL